MKRGVVNILTAGLLLLCLITLWLWLGSYTRAQYLHASRLALLSESGSLGLGWSDGPGDPLRVFSIEAQQPRPAPHPFGRFDHELLVLPGDGRLRPGKHRVVWFPAWVICAVLFAVPACRGLRWSRGRRKAGWCRGCGYDLRGSASATCPECGAASLARETTA